MEAALSFANNICPVKVTQVHHYNAYKHSPPFG